MKNTLENGKLTIYLEGELNSANAETVEKEIDALLGNNNFTALILDMEKLRYMSSAGIRIVIRIKQQHDNLQITNVPKDVHDIFKMVGLLGLLNID